MIKVILTTLLFFLGALIAPHLVFALDNDSNQFGQCDISINGTALTPSSTATVFSNSTSDEQATYTIRVCGNVFSQGLGDQDDSPNNCMDAGDGAGPSGQELKAAVNVGTLNWRDFSIDQFDGSCYTGTITLPTSNSRSTSPLAIDIELDNDSDQICRSEMPVCQRVTAIFNQEILADNSATCEEMQSSIENCSFLSISSTGDQIYVNQPMTIFGDINPLAKSEQCGTQDAGDPRLIITGPDGEVLDERYSFGSGVNASFTPERLGDYELNFSISDSTVYGGADIYGASSFNFECNKTFRVCADGDANCVSINQNTGEAGDYSICESNLGPSSAASGACKSCYGAGGIWTAVGCISQDPRSLVSKLINVGIGISGGIALLIILASAFSLTMSQGDLKKTSDAKEWLTAAVIGLIFIILSVSILEFIGNTVLRIPGFGG